MSAAKEAPKPAEDDAPPSYWYPEKNESSTPARIPLHKSRLRMLCTSSTVWAVLILPLLSFLLYTSEKNETVSHLINHARAHARAYANVEVGGVAMMYPIVGLMIVLSLWLLVRLMSKKARPVYLVDFVVWEPPKAWHVSHAWFSKILTTVPIFTPENIDFQQKIIHRSGLGNNTAWPPESQEMQHNFQLARDETTTIFGDILDELFAKSGLKPQQIDILVVNSSLFNPTPSLASLVINKYKMRSDILSYSLAGMGCSAGVISLDLARELLQTHKNGYAIVLSTENISSNFYFGNDKNKLVQNCLFRAGGAALLLTNKSNINAKYQLECTVRVCNANDDNSYQAIFEEQDDIGQRGVSLVSARVLMPAVSDALRKNMTVLGPQVLPFTEKMRFLSNHVARSVLGRKRIAPYIPNFRKAFQHFCIHAGGKAVIDGMEKNLKLTPADLEPARATLYKMGNVSSASIWYELNYIEKATGVRVGDKVWQLAFGSGIKCNSAVWKALRNIPKTATKPANF